MTQRAGFAPAAGHGRNASAKRPNVRRTNDLEVGRSVDQDGPSLAKAAGLLLQLPEQEAERAATRALAAKEPTEPPSNGFVESAKNPSATQGGWVILKISQRR